MTVTFDEHEKLLKKFEQLDPDWRSRVEAMSVEEIKTVLVEVQKSEEANQDAKKNDDDLNSLKEQVKEASLGYKEVTNANKLKIKYALRTLQSKGG